MLFEVSKESVVSEMLQTGGVIGHDIDFSREVCDLMAVAMLALVHAGEAAQQGGRSGARHSTFVCSGHGGSVVAPSGYGGILHAVLSRLESNLSKESSLF